MLLYVQTVFHENILRVVISNCLLAGRGSFRTGWTSCVDSFCEESASYDRNMILRLRCNSLVTLPKRLKYILKITAFLINTEMF